MYKRNIQGIDYLLVFKSVKNINLRIRRDGEVRVSAPYNTPINYIEAFILNNKETIMRTKESVAGAAPFCYSENDMENFKKRCFNQLDSFYNLYFSSIFPRPKLVFKELKSAWGICHTKKGYITINTKLIGFSFEYTQYVILHELVHFIHADHQKGFYSSIEQIMPDYKRRISQIKKRQ